MLRPSLFYFSFLHLPCRILRARLTFKCVLFSFFWYVLIGTLPVQGQNIQYTKNTADLKLRNNLSVNPSTRAVELQIPLGDYPGRAGSNLPVTISYSSKVWRIDYQAYRPNYLDGQD